MTGLMLELVGEICGYLPESQRLEVGSLSKLLRDSDAVWHGLYALRFGDERRVTTRGSWRASYCRRVEEPMAEDVVEVSWHGKFNLSLGGRDSRTVRAGCSWWAARVVGVETNSRYKVSYPGWSAGWDEAVDRSRVRWPAADLKCAEAKSGDDVEICFRPESWQTRPPVWLEARVLRTRKQRLLIVPLPATTKNKKFWIDEDKVCASRKKKKTTNKKKPLLNNNNDGTSDDRLFAKCLGGHRYRRAIALSERIRAVLLASFV
mmetsp:Transcript_19733/g.63457  ORF Transcript_19733/g.63457 Transcript_19733/m.63457 type:complete len:262 (+) Transcript_19733:201-986(+)|eukprot:CAMPEP_0118914878 /NCGR_PEP_ID=MMETSP1166-20130328/15183_1 /TAXON_ID=1104430 /ORGANISM="Chrysoreinhardia sp, Strain CCMP3193" /LENGTH=261 /DNA_ID=CAMNT_0006854511 /DNA_START=186 /DNA_END=971 /DNA_ORIENTATION=+